MSAGGAAAAGAQAFGTGLQLYGAYRGARMAKTLGRMRRRTAETAAKQTFAAGQRSALEERRQADLLASRAIAVAAAGGGRSDDPSVSKIIADIHGEGAYRAAVALYDAEEQARQLRYEGKMAEASGKIEAGNIQLQAVASALGSAGSMGANYKMGAYG